MFEEGLLNEVKELYDNNIKGKAIDTGIGYKELYQYFDGKISLDEAIDLIKKNSRHFIKRQYTFFEHQMNMNWVNVDYNNFDNTINKCKELIEKH
jgi:tRNA dimethylallyltransferase